MKHIEKIVRKIEFIESIENLNNLFLELKNIFHYSWIGLVVFEPSSTQGYTANFFGQIPNEITQFILQDKTIKSHCLHESHPINYRNLLIDTDLSKISISVDRLFPIGRSELIIPINGLGSEFACLMLAVPEQIVQPQLLEKIGWYWLMLSASIYTKYKKAVSSNKCSMTKRELECISWAAEGKTSWEISQLLSISQRTVDFHLANCITKTDSINRQQAIVKCVRHGHLLAM